MNIRQELFNLPGRISSFENELLRCQLAAEDIGTWLKMWELEQADQINNATDEYGKPAYSNDAKRRAELERRKQASQEYAENTSEKATLDVAIKKVEIELKSLYNTQGNLRAICRLSDPEFEPDRERAG